MIGRSTRMLSVLAGLTLLAGALGCSGLNELTNPATTPAPSAAAAPPVAAAPVAAQVVVDTSLLLTDPPGFQAVGHGSGATAAPIYVTISLNINDFLRAEREDQAVHRFLDDTRRVGIDPIELSFNEEVLQALLNVDPQLVGAVMARKPTVNEHYRLLEWRRLITTERELFFTDPFTGALDRNRPGSLVAIQKAFGVTPRDNGGVIADLLRRRWVQGSVTASLVAQGVSKVDRSDLIIHPDRLVAASLDPNHTDGHEHVNAYLSVFRMMDRVKAGQKVSTVETADRLGDMVRWAHYLKLQGFDTTRVSGLAGFVDTSRLGGFMLAPSEIGATDQEAAAVQTRAAMDPAGTAAAMDTVFTAMCAVDCAWRTPAEELSGRLAALDPNTAWTGRLSWHASNDYTVESYSKFMNGQAARTSGMKAAATRTDPEQQQIIAAYNAVLQVLKDNPRVRFVSFDNDTQWLPENSPTKGYPAVLGVDFGAVPGALDPAQVDELARSQGLNPPSAEGGRPRDARPGGQGGQGGGARPGGGGGARGEHRPDAEGTRMHSGPRPKGSTQDGPRLQPRQHTQ